MSSNLSGQVLTENKTELPRMQSKTDIRQRKKTPKKGVFIDKAFKMKILQIIHNYLVFKMPFS